MRNSLGSISTWCFAISLIPGLAVLQGTWASQENTLTKTDGSKGQESSEKIDPTTARKEAEEKKAREAARKRGELTFDDLKFEIERDAKFEPTMLNDEVKSLNKRIVRIRGYILPTSVFQQKGIKQFVLVRDNQDCCFGPWAMIYDCIIIEMEEPKTIDFTTRPITVKGKIEIDTDSYKYPDGKNFAIYKMKVNEAK